jgi:hypothetical protein
MAAQLVASRAVLSSTELVFLCESLFCTPYECSAARVATARLVSLLTPVVDVQCGWGEGDSIFIIIDTEPYSLNVRLKDETSVLGETSLGMAKFRHRGCALLSSC